MLKYQLWTAMTSLRRSFISWLTQLGRVACFIITGNGNWRMTCSVNKERKLTTIETHLLIYPGTGMVTMRYTKTPSFISPLSSFEDFTNRRRILPKTWCLWRPTQIVRELPKWHMLGMERWFIVIILVVFLDSGSKTTQRLINLRFPCLVCAHSDDIPDFHWSFVMVPHLVK